MEFINSFCGTPEDEGEWREAPAVTARFFGEDEEVTEITRQPEDAGELRHALFTRLKSVPDEAERASFSFSAREVKVCTGASSRGVDNTCLDARRLRS